MSAVLSSVATGHIEPLNPRNVASVTEEVYLIDIHFNLRHVWLMNTVLGRSALSIFTQSR